MPDFAIVDTHVHLWDPARIPLAWGAKAPAINRPHLIPELDHARGDVEIESFVFLECDVVKGRHLDEAAFVEDIAENEPRLAAIVAHAPLEMGAPVAADLEMLKRHKLIRGIRRLIQEEPDLDFCLRPDFVEGVRLLPKYDFHFEICVIHPQLANAVELVKQCPDVTFILDHIGKPAIRDGLTDPWKQDIKALSELPNVDCKMSGLVTEANHASWQPQDLRPYIDHVVECFGFDRLMFGGDWPVASLASDYPRWVDVLDDALHGIEKHELKKMYRDNAIKFYRLDD